MPDDIDLIHCPRQPGALVLSRETCALLYRRSFKAPVWDACRLCRGCRIGATNAGMPLPVEPVKPAEHCCWCGKPVGLARRLIYGALCPSCHARLNEHARRTYRRTQPTGIARSLRVFAVHLEG